LLGYDEQYRDSATLLDPVLALELMAASESGDDDGKGFFSVVENY
jgi:hypothetical protein